MGLKDLLEDILENYPKAVAADRRTNNPYFIELKKKIADALGPIAAKYGFKIKAVGGQGYVRDNPYISFLLDRHKTSRGFYPRYYIPVNTQCVEFGCNDSDQAPPPRELASKLALTLSQHLPRFTLRVDEYPGIRYQRSELDEEVLRKDLEDCLKAFRSCTEQFVDELDEFLGSDEEDKDIAEDIDGGAIDKRGSVETSTFRLDRKQACEVFEDLVPEPESRKNLIRILGAQIKTLHAINPANWSISLYASKRVISLTCGHIFATLVTGKEVEFLLSTATDLSMFQGQGQLRDWNPAAPEKRGELKVLVTSPSNLGRIAGDLPLAQAGFFNSMKQYLIHWKAKETYSPGLIEYLSEELGEQLPHPSYYQRDGAARAARRVWVMAAGAGGEKAPTFLDESYVALGMDDYELGDLQQYADEKELIKKISLNERGDMPGHDRTAILEFVGQMRSGDLIILKSGVEATFAVGTVDSEYYFEADARRYQHRRKVKWLKTGRWEHPLVRYPVKTLSEYTGRTGDLAKLAEIIGFDFAKAGVTLMATLGPLNRIFYGPPGTGKTFYLKNELVRAFTDRASMVSEEVRLSALVQDLAWWEIVAAALAISGKQEVSDLLLHPLVKAKCRNSKAKHFGPAVWASLQIHTSRECENVKYSSRTEPLLFWKSAESVWDFAPGAIDELPAAVAELIEAYKGQGTSGEEVRRYEFVTFHQSYCYEDFIEGIKPKSDQATGQLRYEIVPGVFKRLADRARMDPEKNYAIFIDEINRANVASVFGELITLIEEDKREGAPNELAVTLPYSKEVFSVPRNLYIVGTMNTADRSVEALDTALRRRFSFTELEPDAGIFARMGIRCGGIDLGLMLEAINDRLERLLDRDHRLGHAFFLKVKEREPVGALREIFRDGVLPLLKEFFFGDFGRIGLVLGDDFVTEVTGSAVFSSFEHESKEEFGERKVYKLIDPMTLGEESFRKIYEG